MMMTATALWAVCAAAVGPAPADLVIENARIWSDGLPAFAAFAAVEDGRFVYVGERIGGYVGPGTRRVDAGGRVVVPGLIDAHVHMLSGGRSLSELQLRDVSGRAEFLERIAAWAERLADEPTDAGAPEPWIRGGRWSTESWLDTDGPTKEWVDPVSRGLPLYLPRMDGHSALVNSRGLAIAGITADSPPDPEGGVIDRDPGTGEPTGILRESAMGLVAAHLPGTDLDEDVKALRRAMQEANRHGITAVVDIPDIGSFPAYERLAYAQPTVRFYLYPTAPNWEASASTLADFPARPGWVEVKGFKAYLDGSLGSRTAFMRRPFLGNEPGRESWRGLLREGVADGQFAGNLAVARGAGLQVITHAIGDEANHLLLDSLEVVFADGLATARCRSEHAQHLLPEDIPRFGRLGVIASMQPFHKADDGRYAESYIGAERCRTSYAFKSLLDAGAVVVFGSDWPVVSINPFLGIEAAVTGRTLDGKFWQTQECITVAEALRCYTSRAAWALGAEHEIGRIAAGLRADFVILEGSPFAGDVEWGAIAPAAVYVEGRRVHGAE